MNSVFSDIGITVMDFVPISLYFAHAMLYFFGIKDKKYSWLGYLMLVIVVLQWMIIVLFRDGLPVKIFATIIVITTLSVGVIVSRRRGLEDAHKE